MTRKEPFVTLRKMEELRERCKLHGLRLTVNTYDGKFVISPVTGSITHAIYGKGELLSSTDLDDLDKVVKGMGIILGGLRDYVGMDGAHVKHQREMKETMDKLKTPTEEEEEFDDD